MSQQQTPAQEHLQRLLRRIPHLVQESGHVFLSEHNGSEWHAVLQAHHAGLIPMHPTGLRENDIYTYYIQQLHGMFVRAEYEMYDGGADAEKSWRPKKK